MTFWYQSFHCESSLSFNGFGWLCAFFLKCCVFLMSFALVCNSSIFCFVKTCVCGKMDDISLLLRACISVDAVTALFVNDRHPMPATLPAIVNQPFLINLGFYSERVIYCKSTRSWLTSISNRFGWSVSSLQEFDVPYTAHT